MFISKECLSGKLSKKLSGKKYLSEQLSWAVIVKHKIEPENYQKYPASIEDIPVRLLRKQGFSPAERPGYGSEPAEVCRPVPQNIGY
jgi:hypothetical protein